MAIARRTRNHDEIRRWVEENGGRPAQLEGTSGVLRIDFGEAEESLEPIEWESFFEIFDECDLDFLYDPIGRATAFVNVSDGDDEEYEDAEYSEVEEDEVKPVSGSRKKSTRKKTPVRKKATARKATATRKKATSTRKKATSTRKKSTGARKKSAGRKKSSTVKKSPARKKSRKKKR